MVPDCLKQNTRVGEDLLTLTMLPSGEACDFRGYAELFNKGGSFRCGCPQGELSAPQKANTISKPATMRGGIRLEKPIEQKLIANFFRLTAPKEKNA